MYTIYYISRLLRCTKVAAIFLVSEIFCFSSWIYNALAKFSSDS